MAVLGFETRLSWYKSLVWTITDYRLLLLNISKETNNMFVKVKLRELQNVLLFTELLNV
jgi:hypothetical protein